MRYDVVVLLTSVLAFASGMAMIVYAIAELARICA